MKKKITTKDICYVGLGIALYIVLSVFLQISLMNSFYLCFGYIAMLVYCYSFGSISGAIVGGIGCLLYCFIINGLRGMPGWVTGNIFIGIVLGLWFKFIKNKKINIFIKNILHIIVIIVTTSLAMLCIKSTVECVLYTQPFLVRATTNFTAFVADSIVLIVGLPICPLLDKIIVKLQK